VDELAGVAGAACEGELSWVGGIVGFSVTTGEAVPLAQPATNRAMIKNETKRGNFMKPSRIGMVLTFHSRILFIIL
jgi:hypothetical protein